MFSRKYIFNFFGAVLVATTLFSSFVTSPTVQAQTTSTTSPKLKMIVVTCTPETCLTNGSLDWSKATFSNNKQYTDYVCTQNGTFANQPVLGIDDYKDGIMRKHYKNFSGKQNLVTHPFGDANINSDLRNCKYRNAAAGNFDAMCDVNWDDLIKRPDQEIEPIYTCNAIGQGYLGDNNPVYAYQFRYNIKFTEANKTEQSNLYRNLTGFDATYDGVNMTYTYYTYKKDGQYLPWENPNKDNANGGWLVYGTRSQTCPANVCTSGETDPVLAEGVYTTIIKDNMNQDLTLTYNANTKTLRFGGNVVVGNSGCWSLGSNHSFLIKPNSTGTYNTFKLFYETKNSGSQMCTANIPTVNLEYTQNMSDLNKAGEDFLINYISQNRFQASDVQSYTGLVPPVG